MGRPTTRKSAPARRASQGVMVRRWSSGGDPGKRMPGVTTVKAGPQAARMAATSWGDATTPSSPAAFACAASRAA